MASWFEKLKRIVLGGENSAEEARSSSLAEPERPKASPVESSLKHVRVVIGLDFGTSSTKVVFRKIGENQAWMAPSPVPHAEFAWFCTPTTVAEIDGKVRFGELGKPEEREGRLPLKLQLLDCGDDLDRMSEAERKAIGYLGWILESVFLAIREQYGVPDFQPILNIGIPVAFFGDREIKNERSKHYESVARAALATTRLLGGSGIQNGMPAEQCNLVIQKAWQKKADFDLVGAHPESISVLVSMQQDPLVEEGLYSVVDIGAGTTEITTTLLFTSSSSQRQLACYQDSSERVGIFEYPLGANQGETQLAQNLLHKWWRQFEINWETSRRKDAQNPVTHQAWYKTNVLFTGGGGFHPDVQPYFQRRIEADSPAHIHFGKGGWSMPIQAYQPSRQALKPCRMSSSEERDAFHLGAVAHGLSFHRREWPDWYRPEEVEAIDGPELNSLPFDPTEAGYHGR